MQNSEQLYYFKHYVLSPITVYKEDNKWIILKEEWKLNMENRKKRGNIGSEGHELIWNQEILGMM